MQCGTFASFRSFGKASLFSRNIKEQIIKQSTSHVIIITLADSYRHIIVIIISISSLSVDYTVIILLN